MSGIDEQGQLTRIDYGDRVYFDSVLGWAGTTYPIGTADMPSSVIADTIAICAARHVNKINVTGTLTIGTGIAQDLVGHNCILTGQTAGLAYVRDFSGYLEVDAMIGGTLDIYADAADIQINGDCTAGTINIYGNARVTGAGGGVAINNYTLNVSADNRVAGKLQIAETTIDLNQGAASYDLFTGTDQDVVVENLVIRTPNIVAGGALTNISIQTDDATPQVFITAVQGAVANLTAEAQLSWAPADGITLIKVGKKIRLTIGGGAHGAAYVCDVIALCRAVVSGGYLA